MAIIEKHAPGSFCWMELGTTDLNSAKHFYTNLFGWEFNDNDMGPSGVYTIFTLNGRDCAAAYTLNQQMLEQHVPPNWMIYIATANVDETTKRVGELGGAALMDPFDAGPYGRMSVAKDPAGAYFSLWQAKMNPGIGIAGEYGAFCWADLHTTDREGAKKFYSALLGWKFETGQGKDESGYLHIVNGADMIGGLASEGTLQPGVPPHWLIYYLVADCDAHTAKANSLGARTLMPPMDIEGAGRMSVLADPQGAVFAIFKSTM